MSSTLAQDYSAYKKERFVKGQDTLPYRILLPKNYDATKKYPMILFLHGSGERGSDNELQLTHGADLFLKPEVQAQFPAIVVFPQCKENRSWNNTAYNIAYGKRVFNYPAVVKPNVHQELLESLIDNLKSEYPIDAQRLYIGGLSMGGMGTFEAVLRNPDLFAAAFAICGGANPRISETLSNTPFWIFHGEQDNVVPIQGSRKIYEALKEKNADVKFTAYPGVEHDSWTNAFAEPELLPWLFSKSR
ncbi:MAG: prolyl oligopeptidase family serine peptidase [Bacteroidota bacterium]